jgi:hypothetical protein
MVESIIFDDESEDMFSIRLCHGYCCEILDRENPVRSSQCSESYLVSSQGGWIRRADQNAAVKRGYLKENPLGAIEIPSRETTLPKILP